MTTEQNKTLVRQFIEEFLTQGNVNMVKEIVAPDFIENEQLPPGMPQGREGVEMLAPMLHGGFSDFKATIEDIIAEDDKVMVRMTWSGTQTGEFMGLPPSGKAMSVAIIDIFRLAEGKIMEHWGVSDMMGMMQQLGAMPE
jgi:steroid delta-isomerase-like uncharacterized protein